MKVNAARTLVQGQAARATGACHFTPQPQPALTHHPAPIPARLFWAAGVQEQQRIVIAICQLAGAAMDAQRRALDGGHGNARQQANSHGHAQHAVIGNIGGHVGQGGASFARRVRSLEPGVMAGVELNQGHVITAAQERQAGSARERGSWHPVLPEQYRKRAG
ncbi:hypothetical protein, partial [Diaphorobacter sp.]|uniref:hypothetical protein n=1 Tax=Diaphorobacter sp. TaxID=1934310 RepID=UPI003D117072